MDRGCPLLRGSSDRRLRRCAATDALQKIENFYFSSNYSSYFSVFPNSKSFWFFFAKNLLIKLKKTISGILEFLSFDTPSTANFPPCDFDKIQVFFIKKTIYFFKKNLILCILKNLTISVALYGNFFVIWWLKIFKFRNSAFCLDNWQVNVRKLAFLSRCFSFHIINMGGK